MKYLKKLKVELVKGDFKNPIKGQVQGPEQVFAVFKDIKDWAKETLIGVYLNDCLELNSYEIHSVGGESVSLVLPDEIFQSAILTRSRNFILIHNHPSGKAYPSEADKEVMQVIKDQCKVMNRTFLDFIIVGEDAYWSMFEEESGGEYALGVAA
ncbi:MAG: repair protein RadC [Flavipsychrobacter sp.]|nr:repair protein RadC [Flavipsychrobacter sp.]